LPFDISGEDDVSVMHIGRNGIEEVRGPPRGFSHDDEFLGESDLSQLSERIEQGAEVFSRFQIAHVEDISVRQPVACPYGWDAIGNVIGEEGGINAGIDDSDFVGVIRKVACDIISGSLRNGDDGGGFSRGCLEKCPVIEGIG